MRLFRIKQRQLQWRILHQDELRVAELGVAILEPPPEEEFLLAEEVSGADCRVRRLPPERGISKREKSFESKKITTKFWISLRDPEPYKHNGRTYTLKTESIIDPVINETENGLVLRGFTPEEVEAYGLNAGLPGGRQQPTTNVGIPADTRGVIKNGKGEVVPTDRKGAGSTPAGAPATSNRTVNRSGVSATAKSSSGRTVKNTNKGTIRGGIDNETPDQKASRKQLEATLGIDLQKNPEGAIRQLEGLQRNQGGRPSRDQ